MKSHTFTAVLAGFTLASSALTAAEAGVPDKVPLLEMPPIIVTATQRHVSSRDENIEAIALKTGIVRLGDDLHL